MESVTHQEMQNLKQHRCLPPQVNTRGKDKFLKPLWSQHIFAVHLQDSRLTKIERGVLAALGYRLYGFKDEPKKEPKRNDS